MGFCFSLPEPPPRQQQPGGVAMAPRPVADPALQAFHHYDKDRNGYIEARELAPLLLGLGFFRGMPPEKVQGAVLGELQKADRDGDFAINYQEFVPYFRHLCQVAAQRGHLPPTLAQPQYFGAPPAGGANPGYPPAGYPAAAPGGPAPAAARGAPAPAKGGASKGMGVGAVVAAGAVGAVGGAALAGADFGAVGDFAGDAAGAVGDFAGDAAGAVGDFAGDAAGWVGDGASSAWEATTDWAPGAMDTAGDAVGSVGEFFGDALGSLGDFF